MYNSASQWKEGDSSHNLDSSSRRRVDDVILQENVFTCNHLIACVTVACGGAMFREWTRTIMGRERGKVCSPDTRAETCERRIESRKKRRETATEHKNLDEVTIRQRKHKQFQEST